MIRRETDPDLINRVSNEMGVREWVCYHDQPMEWQPAFPSLDSGIIVLSDGEEACAAFAATDHRVFQVHTLFGPDCRGRKAVQTGRDMIEWMRPHADLIWGATPLSNPQARWFNRQLGAKALGRQVYETEGEVEIFELRLNETHKTGIGILAKELAE